MEQYRAHSAVSQSQLKLLLGPIPNMFNTIEEPDLYFEEKQHFIVGDAVDCLLTRGKEEYNEKFYVSRLENKPSDTVKSIINQVFDSVEGEKTRLSDYREQILQACNDHSYQVNWKEDTRFNKIVENWEYWESLKESEGKIVLSTEDETLINSIVMSLKTHSYTAKYFQETPDIQIFYQVPIYFTYEEVECKALLDMVIVDYKEKTVQPIDIKTMGDKNIYFPKSLRQRRYDIQAAFYTEALEKFKADSGIVDFTTLRFKFLVESTQNPGTPLVFTCDQTILNIGKEGREEYYSETSGFYLPELKGFHQLIEDYKWYMENNFENSKRVIESEGHFLMDWNGIIN